MNKGVVTEALFDFIATEKGMVVSRPLADIGYDRIVDCNGKLTRVQIKTSSYKQNGSYIAKTSGRENRRYIDEFDILAIHIRPIDIWVILPFSAITSSAMRIYVDTKSAKYVNNWKLFYAEN